MFCFSDSKDSFSSEKGRGPLPPFDKKFPRSEVFRRELGSGDHLRPSGPRPDSLEFAMNGRKTYRRKALQTLTGGRRPLKGKASRQTATEHRARTQCPPSRTRTTRRAGTRREETKRRRAARREGSRRESRAPPVAATLPSAPAVHLRQQAPAEQPLCTCFVFSSNKQHL